MWKRVALVYMVSQTALTCERYAADCTKTKAKILRPESSEKEKNAPDFRRKQPKSGAFRVLEGMRMVEDG